MNKYKVSVYAICKNEEKFVERWIENIKEADEIVVLDTGSTDNTVELLKKNGAKVYIEEIKPWRFDVARNKSLNLVSEDTDICLCIDLDEVIDKGWRLKLEELWDDNTNRVAYNYNWSFDDYGNPAVNFYIDKIHDRRNYIWHHPVHEVLKYVGKKEEIKKTTDLFTVNHYPDNKKGRSQYLPLLELSVKEDPNDDRNMHYLGREYMFNERYQEAIDIFHKHLKLPNAKWIPERSASMRYMARCYKALDKLEEARMWFERAINEYPKGREGFVELALFEYNKEEYNNAYILLRNALNINERNKIYINENFCWDSTIYDILSICAFKMNKIDESYNYVCEALEIDPKNGRLKKNKKIIKKILEAKNE